MIALIKPCPFCGDDRPVVMHTGDRSIKWVRCRNKNCLSEGPEIDSEDLDDEVSWIERERLHTEAAIDAWNKRPKLPKAKEQEVKHKTKPDY